jgi:hypothetical protein
VTAAAAAAAAAAVQVETAAVSHQLPQQGLSSQAARVQAAHRVATAEGGSDPITALPSPANSFDSTVL